MISNALQSTLQAALEDAAARRHEYVSVEHLLLALLNDHEGQKVLFHCGASLDRLRAKVGDYLEKEVERLPSGRRSVPPRQTVAFRRVLERAITHVRHSSKKEVDTGDVLASILEEPDTHAAWFLQQEGISRLDILNFICHGISKVEPELEPEEGEPSPENSEQETPARGDPLAQFTINLTQRAAEGKIDPLIGRERELRRTMQVLCRRLKNNPIYVGEPGVGKTALVEGLALRVVEERVPAPLRGTEIYLLDMGALLAGTRFRGDFEQRMKAVLGALAQRRNVILFIDEIHTVIGAGSTQGSTMDASNLLKPVLVTGELRCIGSTTYEEYKNHFEKDRALSRRFQRIEITEPSVEETIEILRGLRSRFEAHHRICYTDEALVAAAELAAKHINDRFLPDKAIDVIDEAGAGVALEPQAAEDITVDADRIERVVADIARIPVRSVSASDRQRLAALESDLRQRVFGQDAAIHALVTAIKRSRAGLGLPDKPIGSFLFSGPTGVGKTEVARQLAELLGIHFGRYDMSEYMEKHAVARLIGAPPGYVGFDQGGLLTDEIIRHPHSVLLLDEIEKAHEDLFNILLQVMDHATLTDNNGRKADFRNVILILTSNAGAREMAGSTVGFEPGAGDARHTGMKAIEKAFSPEFRNRLDAILIFNSLSPEIVERIVDKFVHELQTQLAPRQVQLVLEPEARAWLARRGYDRTYGARPLSRLIQTEIKDRLSDELLFGRLAAGGTVRVQLQDDALVFDFA